jgi:hypothetical protein
MCPGDAPAGRLERLAERLDEEIGRIAAKAFDAFLKDTSSGIDRSDRLPL